MSKYHLMYWVWKYLASHGMEIDIINRAREDKWEFSEPRQEGQISVAEALEESFERFKAANENSKKSDRQTTVA